MTHERKKIVISILIPSAVDNKGLRAKINALTSKSFQKVMKSLSVHVK